MQINLLGFDLEHLKNIFIENGLTALDAKRVFPWIHKKLAKTFDEMSDVPLRVREKLKEKFSLSRGNCLIEQESRDGTRKTLMEFSDGNRVETVFIPDEKRNTVCVSSQVGCAMGCKFCHTGTQGFIRNLASSEIISQIIFWKDRFPISNVVFMGMGEPFLNARNLFEALSILLDKKTHNFSRNKITVSSCGIVGDQLRDLSKFGVKLAISLHAPNDEIRSSLMPINNRYKISQVLEASKEYQKESNTEKITFEYLLLNEINDSLDHARQLAKILKSFPSKVNLIIYNDWPGSEFKGTKKSKADQFALELIRNKVRATIRQSKGDDILAACGQLKGESRK